jgi:hypothetical protein
MIKIKHLTIKNFLSIGNQTQSINFNQDQLTLILGENLDLGGTDVGSKNGAGKAQPLTSKILTPSGWTTMGELSVGDEVLSQDGTPSKITGIYPQGQLKTYQITFEDGRSCEASGEHLWQVDHYRKDDLKTEVLTTEEILQTMHKRGLYKIVSRYYVPLYNPIIKDDVELPINPWLMGMMIGVGNFQGNCNEFTTKDPHIIDRAATIGIEYNTMVQKLSNNTYKFGIYGADRQETVFKFLDIIESLGLYGLKLEKRFVPSIFKNASDRQKIKFLQGLTDAIGAVQNNSITFAINSDQLKDDILDMVRGMGGIARCITVELHGKKNNNKHLHRLAITTPPGKILSTTNKNTRRHTTEYVEPLGLKIVDIVEVGEKECQCISIDHPSKLYVTDHYIVTHNTVVTHAISYALYGQAMSNIKKDNMINRTNAKNMFVSIMFEKNGRSYRIERGRKPAILRVFIDDNEQQFQDEAQGDSRETQKFIDALFGMNHLMFKNIVILNTYTDPFLAMKAADQRDIIENLLGITLLTEKADVLKGEIKSTKDGIFQESSYIDAVTQANAKIKQSIDTLKMRQTMWGENRDKECIVLYNKIEELKKIDIESEVENHNLLVEYNKKLSDLVSLKKDQTSLDTLLNQQDRMYEKYTKDINTLVEENRCPVCEQSIDSHKHEDMIAESKAALAKCEDEMRETATALLEILNEIDAVNLGEQPTTFYPKLSDALAHQNNLMNLEQKLQSKLEENDPYQEQIDTISENAIQEISYDKVNSLTSLKDHQEFLLKLLTNKDSFVRKKIIDQNLAYLNNRLNYYLDKIGLIHRVSFQNDLSVDITYMGHDLDFHNLSRGEMTRVTLSLSWAFRDVWENLYDSINLMFIDELIDNGMDYSGADNALSVMQSMVYERNKNIFLISHKEELITKVNNVMIAVKENGFTSYHAA